MPQIQNPSLTTAFQGTCAPMRLDYILREVEDVGKICRNVELMFWDEEGGNEGLGRDMLLSVCLP